MIEMMSAVRTSHLECCVMLDLYNSSKGTFYLKFYFLFMFQVPFVHSIRTVSHCINHRGRTILKGVGLNILEFPLQR